MANQRHKADAFKRLHTSPGGFVMPNAWDAGSAMLLAEAGFAALGTTSAGIAFSLGRPDFDVPDAGQAVTREEMFERIRQIVDAVALPVNGDLEDGYGDRPEAVAETVRMAIEAGLAGGNIEDHNPRGRAELYDEELAVDRIRAAREAIDAGSNSFVLNAKIDALILAPHDGLKTSIRRANRFREAGADCVFPCGVSDLESVRTLVRETDGPLNLVLGWGTARLNAATLIDAGITRISLGGSIARSALGFVRACARELHERGTIDFAAHQMGQGELNALFARAPRG
jgi:2-methylisocitrate lyase-like PEP mutase family enzyme